ncbi:hypothetical protein BJ878DRAFT_179647 [Calycina marina]|uniref:Beta-lactamase-like protein n=1 Tax=Calycina marina TaxID=1763456 RepID=A0A9P7YZI6_9HELO|nr:hypothetical protein BJ878DRAFT_179647 [Calycina marina]
MSEKLVPKNPEEVMVIREIAPGVTTLSVPFLRFGMIKFGGRATIVKMSSGSLAVFNPVSLTPTVQTKIKELGGPVSYIAAPDIEHHIFLSSWAAAFPAAHLIAPEGLAEKRATLNASNPDISILPFNSIFTKANKSTLKVSDEFEQDFETEFVDAHRNKELVFFHKGSGTLIEADLMFNLPATEQYSRTGESAGSGWATIIACALQGTKGNAKWQKRIIWYGLSNATGDRKGFGESVQRIAGWPIRNIVPSHGDTILGEGKEVFEKVFQWHLEGKK